MFLSYSSSSASESGLSSPRKNFTSEEMNRNKILSVSDRFLRSEPVFLQGTVQACVSITNNRDGNRTEETQSFQADEAMESATREEKKKEDELEKNYFDAVLRANTEDETLVLEIAEDVDVGRGGNRGVIEVVEYSSQSSSKSFAMRDFSDISILPSPSTSYPLPPGPLPTQIINTESIATVASPNVVGGIVAAAAVASNAAAGVEASPPAPLVTSMSMSRLFSISNPFSTDYRQKNDMAKSEGRVRSISQESGTGYGKSNDDENVKEENRLDFSTFSAAATAMRRSQLQALSRRNQAAAADAAAADAATVIAINAKDEGDLQNEKKEGKLESKDAEVDVEEEQEEELGQIAMGGRIGPHTVASSKVSILPTKAEIISETLSVSDDRPLRSVKGRPVTLLSSGALVCNLPDHRISGGCTAIVALKIGMKLYVANAGKRREKKQ